MFSFFGKLRMYISYKIIYRFVIVEVVEPVYFVEKFWILQKIDTLGQSSCEESCNFPCEEIVDKNQLSTKRKNPQNSQAILHKTCPQKKQNVLNRRCGKSVIFNFFHQIFDFGIKRDAFFHFLFHLFDWWHNCAVIAI